LTTNKPTYWLITESKKPDEWSKKKRTAARAKLRGEAWSIAALTRSMRKSTSSLRNHDSRVRR